MYTTRGTPYDRPWSAADFSASLSVCGMQISLGINTPPQTISLSSLDCRSSWSNKPIQRMVFGQPETIANAVVLTSPSPNSQGVPVSTIVSAQYGKSIRQPVTGTGTTKGLFIFDGNTQIPGAVRYVSGSTFTADDVYRRLEFYPTAPLPYDRQLRASAKGQQNLDGTSVPDIE